MMGQKDTPGGGVSHSSEKVVLYGIIFTCLHLKFHFNFHDFECMSHGFLVKDGLFKSEALFTFDQINFLYVPTFLHVNKPNKYDQFVAHSMAVFQQFLTNL